MAPLFSLSGAGVKGFIHDVLESHFRKEARIFTRRFLK